MELLSRTFDSRINSVNLIVETTFGEYLKFAPKIIMNNDLQRKRVRTSKTVYSLLKNDLKCGCVMPPLVLAITDRIDNIDEMDFNQIISEILRITENSTNSLLILDGLQRTYTLIDAQSEIEVEDNDKKVSFYTCPLRLEIYININKFGVLYRMLTLNTGQTPMPVRHQIEMLYCDLLDKTYEGVTLIRDVDGTADPDDNEFSFKNVIEGFNSYMSRNELPIDRQDMLDNIALLEHMSEENVSTDVFSEFLTIYVKIFNRLNQLSGGYTLIEEDRVAYGISESPFGKKVSKVFSTSQAMTGFGAALGRMKDKGIITDVYAIEDSLSRITSDNLEWFFELLIGFDKIKTTSKKIGNAQRMYMQYFFRELFNPDGDSYLNLLSSVKNGYNKYLSQI